MRRLRKRFCSNRRCDFGVNIPLTNKVFAKGGNATYFITFAAAIFENDDRRKMIDEGKALRGEVYYPLSSKLYRIAAAAKRHPAEAGRQGQ